MTDFIISAVINDEVQVVTIAEQGPPGPVKHNIDGGTPDSVYLPSQNIDGGDLDG